MQALITYAIQWVVTARTLTLGSQNVSFPLIWLAGSSKHMGISYRFICLFATLDPSTRTHGTQPLKGPTHLFTYVRMKMTNPSSSPKRSGQSRSTKQAACSHRAMTLCMLGNTIGLKLYTRVVTDTNWNHSTHTGIGQGGHTGGRMEISIMIFYTYGVHL